MALVLKDRVREQSTTTGTGAVTLTGAYDGYRTFASCVPTGSIVYYCIHNTTAGVETEWEVGYGTFTLSGETLSRTSVMASSNAGALVDFSAGLKEVFITYPAEKAIYEETNGETLIDGGPITVIGDNVTSVPALPAELGKFVGNVNLFAQIYNLNQNDGSSASADFVAYNDLTTDGYTNFIDMGINSSTYTSVDYPIFTPGSGYLFHDGDKLFIGTATSNKDVVVFAGGVDTANVALTVSGTDQSVTLVGDLNVGGDLDVTGAATFGSTVTLNADPTTALEAATKQYVDNATSNGFHVHTPVLVATTGNLTATYNNGSSGVGATLTNSGAQAALSVDGVSMAVNDRVLVWQQTSGAQNGVYVVTTVGDGSTNWVLTRASDADTAGEADPNSLGGGDYFFVSSGATLGFFSFVCTNTDTITFGTTAITFTEFSQVPSYVVNAPLNLTGNTLSLSGTVSVANGGTGHNTVGFGDLLFGNNNNSMWILPVGAPYKSLTVDGGGQPSWNAVALNRSGSVSGSLPATNGGTDQSTYTLGDTLYSSAANTLSKLSGNTTTTKKYLSQTGNGTASAAPSWDQVAAADISGLAASATIDTTDAANISSGTLPSGRLAGSYTGVTGVGTLTAGTWNGSTVAVAYGGTGATTLTGYVYGNGTGVMTASTTIPNSATTATSANTASAIVARDASGNFTAGTVTATLSGNASTASALQTARTINGVSFDGSANITVTANTTNTLTRGSYLTGDNFNGSAATTWDVDATSANTASKVVARDGSGNFSAGTITATLSGNASTATTATNLAGGSAGTVPYQSAAGTTAMLAAGTPGQVLQSNGAAAPSWVTPSTANDGTLTMAVSGTGLSGSATFTANQSGASTFTVTSNATSSNTASTIVARDAGGNFSAGTITATLNGSANSAATATASTYVAVGFSGVNSAYQVPFAYATGTSGQLTVDSEGGFTYNPSTDTLTVTSVSGNASTATTLQTARTINDTSFNGSANITTSKWGTARTITIGATGKSVDGSADVSWSLGEIGALATGGGTMTGSLTLSSGSLTVSSGSVSATSLTITGSAQLTGPGGAASNVAIGYQAFNTNISGTYNVIVGNQAGYTQTNLTYSTLIGNQAGYYLKGSSNIAVGANALQGHATAATGVSNVAVGRNAAAGLTYGSSNTFMGDNCAPVVTGANYNVLIGASSGQQLTTGQYNTGVGYYAGAASTGYSNTFIGHYSGSAVTTSSNNAILGSFTGYSNTYELDIRTTSNNGYVVLSNGTGGGAYGVGTPLAVFYPTGLGTQLKTTFGYAGFTTNTTLTGAQVMGQVFRATGAGNFGLTMPTAADLRTALGAVAMGHYFFISFINQSSSACGLVSNTGWTTAGNTAVNAGTSGLFMVQYAGSTTFYLMRMA